MKKKVNSIWKKLVEKTQVRDVIAIPVLLYSLYLIGEGINHIVSGITIMITTYYFSKRIYEERH